jgi:Ca2+-transporting ATPase
VIKENWFNVSAEETIKELQSDREGLSAEEAQRRLSTYGPNEIVEKRKRPAWLAFLEQFKSVLILILIIAIVISAILGEIIDAAAILAIVILIAVLGFGQERKAERALETLKKLAAPTAEVVRDGEIKVVSASQIVPGDILSLKVGDKVPADCRITEQLNLKTDESILTGESIPVVKHEGVLTKDVPIAERSNMLFSGTTVVYGHCRAVVVTTGMATEFGKIAAALRAPEERTPLQVQLDKLGVQLGLIFAGACAVVFIIGFFSGIEMLEILLISIALAVAAVPEGLPAAITIALALGVQRMAKQNAIVRKLTAVETLGCATVICSDKTGTLTLNEMTVRKLWVNGKTIDVTGEGYSTEGKFSLDDKEIDPKQYEDIELLLLTGMTCNDAVIGEQIVGDPTEAALVVAAKKAGLEDMREKCPRLQEISFDSNRKMMSIACTIDNRKIGYAKGAVEEILKRCSSIYLNGEVKPLRGEDKMAVLEASQQFAQSALRVLGFAIKKLKQEEKLIEKDLIFVGLQGMIDPPRPEAKAAIEQCRQAGIKVVMITGDHKDTATAVAHELGLIASDNPELLTGAELDTLDDEQFEEMVEEVKVYARVNPEHKVRITETLRKKGHVVAMTGDGINDAPALKKADIGVAMGIAGTDVSREVSDMVLIDDNFTTIVSAVEHGRGIYENIRKVLAFLLSGNIAEILIVFIAIMIGLPLPLVAIQILWINLVTDGLPALALSVDPVSKDVMRKKPRSKDEGILRGLRAWLIDYPIIVLIGTFALFLWGLQDSIIKAQTIAFTTIIIIEKYQAFNCRSLDRPVGRKIFANRYLVYATILTIGLHFAILYIPYLNSIFHVTPLSLIEWLAILAVGAVGFAYLEGYKFIKYRREGNRIPNKNKA